MVTDFLMTMVMVMMVSWLSFSLPLLAARQGHGQANQDKHKHNQELHASSNSF